MKPEDLKLIVKEKYGSIASQSTTVNNGCSCCDTKYEFSKINDEYIDVKGYNPDADLKLGCGIPTKYARIQNGDSVLDLGSGAGNDCFVARSVVGETGMVTGLDFSEEMLKKANVNLEKSGYENMKFVYGDIDNMPLDDNSFDVVISNCVLNLVPDKEKAFTEIFRVLKPGGHFCISDVVISGTLPEELKNAAEMYAGCVAGALRKDDYLEIIKKQGFAEIKVETQKPTPLPIDVLRNYLTDNEIAEFDNSGTGIFSITVTAKK